MERKFKIGDRVRIIKVMSERRWFTDMGQRIKIGDEGILVPRDDGAGYRIEFKDRGSIKFGLDQWFELVPQSVLPSVLNPKRILTL